MPPPVPARSDGPAPSSGDPAGTAYPPAVAPDYERDAVLARVIAAADDGTLDVDDAGRLVSLAHRARERSDLARITRRLDVADRMAGSAELRRRQWRSVAWLVVCALVSVLMIAGLLYGLGPIDPH